MRRLIWIVLIAALLTPAVARAQEEVVYYHTDAIGSVRMVTDASGAVVARYDYLPFGEVWPASPPNTNPDVRQFAGKERDAETGLDYFGARYYASRSGRFTTVDPALDQQKALLDPQQWNRYSYARSNPLRFLDPDGREVVAIHKGKFYGAGTESLNLRPASFQGVWGEVKNVGRLAGVVVGAVFAPVAAQVATTCVLSWHCQVAMIGAAEGAAGSAATGYAANATGGVRLARQLASQEIAGGHAFTKHVVGRGEFPGIRTRAQFAEVIEGVLNNASEIRTLGGGRTAYWKDGVVVILNPRAADGGTAFVPTTGYKFYKELR